MSLRPFLAMLLFCLGPIAAWGAELPAKPVEVMVVGVFHMSNPGHDIHNLKVDDVLEPKMLPGFVKNAPAMIAPADVALAAFHLSRYVRSEAEKAA